MDNIKDKVKEAISIADIAAEWYGVTLNGKGRGLCPLCKYEKDKTTFCIIEDGQGFYCHHCKKGGDLFTLVMEMEDLDFFAALKKLAGHAGISLNLSPEQEAQYKKEEQKAAALRRFSQFWNNQLTPEAAQYLEKRKIDKEYIDRNCIGYIPEGAVYQAEKNDLFHLKQMGLIYSDKDVNRKWWNRLFIPFWKNGRIAYFAGRGINEKTKPVQFLPSVEEAGKKLVLGNCRNERVFFVEGVFDYLTADQEPELKSVMGILGTSTLFDLPGIVKTVDLCFDWDEAGEKFVEKYGLHFVSQCKAVNMISRPPDLPEGKKDLNDFIQASGKIKDLKMIDISEWFLEKLKAEPTNQTIKENFFKTLVPKGEIERDTNLARMYKEIFKKLDVGKRAITKEFKEFLRDEIKESAPGSFIDEITGKEFKLPDGYTFNGDKLINSIGGERIAEKKIYLTRILKEYTEGQTYCEIVSYFNNEKITSIEPQSVIADKRYIVKLSDKNFPVTSENASKLVNFLHKFKYVNEETLKPLNASSQLGWQGQKFLFPDRVINNKGELEPGYFVGNDPPKDAFISKGDLQTYIDFIREMRQDLKSGRWVIPVFVIYATLSSFILELINAKVIIIHFTEDTGRGKTSIMELAASVYGKYDYHNQWNDTFVGLMRKAVKHKNFPLLINEGSIIEQKKDIAPNVYTLSEGISRTKALMDSPSETLPIKRFHNVIISNGETSLLTGKEASGVLMRVIEFFETFGGQNHQFIEKLEKTIKNNYGLLIEPFIKKVIELGKNKGNIRIKTRDGQDKEINSFGDFPLFEQLDSSDGPHSGNLNRKLKSLQPVYIAGCIAEDLFNFGYDPVEVVGLVFDKCRIEITKNLSRANRVMEGLQEFYQEYRSRFIDLSDVISSVDSESEETAIKEGVRANITTFGYRKDRELLIIPIVFQNHFLKEFNGSDGKSARVIYRELKEKGYIQVDKDGRNTKKCRIGKYGKRVIYFPEFFPCEDEAMFQENSMQDEDWAKTNVF